MVNRIRKTKHKCRQAFTLVELIVILVVLAIIAAITVPALTGYINKAKKQKYMTNAHYAYVASQAVMTELYGLGKGYKASYSDKDNNKNNVNWVNGDNKKWGDKVLSLMDCKRGENDPYILIFGVGNADKICGLTTAQQNTVYYIAYVEDEKSPAIFYVNGEWMYRYPKSDDGPIVEHRYEKNGYNYRNTIKVDDSTFISLQFYIVSNRTGLDPKDAKFWTDTKEPKSLKSHCVE